MPVSEADIRRSARIDRRAVYLGAACTAIATMCLFVLPDLIPIDAFRRWYHGLTGTWVSGNPFSALRLLGGLVGGAVAGSLTSNLGSGGVTGTKSALYGLAVAYVFVVAFYLAYWPIVHGVFPPVITALSIPLVFAIPMFMSHLLGGFAAGTIAHHVRQRLRKRPTAKS